MAFLLWYLFNQIDGAAELIAIPEVALFVKLDISQIVVAFFFARPRFNRRVAQTIGRVGEATGCGEG